MRQTTRALEHLRKAVAALDGTEVSVRRAKQEAAAALELLIAASDPPDPYADAELRPGLNKLQKASVDV